jgi:carotenoid cleavage dioxygenase-like enzyme
MFPVHDEIDVASLRGHGRAARRPAGSFVRNGPNPLFEPIGRYHMFDGDGMLHGVTFDDDGLVPQPVDPLARPAGRGRTSARALYPGLGDVMNFPDRSLVTGDAGPVKNPANTHMIRHAGRYLALWEGGLPTEVTADRSTPSASTTSTAGSGGR